MLATCTGQRGRCDISKDSQPALNHLSARQSPLLVATHYRIRCRAVACSEPRHAQHESCTRGDESNAAETSRRRILSFGILAASALWLPQPDAAQAASGGMGRYIKKKSLDPLETYVPAVLQARSQLLAAGTVMGHDIEGARTLLREGAFAGLRDNIRAMGVYAEQGGVGASDLVNALFLSLQAYDYSLFEAIRFKQPLADNAKDLLDTTVIAMDRLIATVPDETIAKAREIVAAIEKSGLEAQSATPEGTAKQTEELKQLLLE